MANIADESQVKETALKGRRVRERELDDVASILATEFGRRFFWRYLGIAGIYESGFTGDAEGTFFNCGRRDVGLRLLADISEALPDAYIQMIKEAKKREETDA